MRFLVISTFPSVNRELDSKVKRKEHRTFRDNLEMFDYSCSIHRDLVTQFIPSLIYDGLRLYKEK